MKRFGVQLAAGGVTILLGALAAAHAQKDGTSEPDPSWQVGSPPNLQEPPQPIADYAADSWNDHAPDLSADPGLAAHPDNPMRIADDLPATPASSNPVKLVQHVEVAEPADSFPDTPPSLDHLSELGFNFDEPISATVGEPTSSAAMPPEDSQRAAKPQSEAETLLMPDAATNESSPPEANLADSPAPTMSFGLPVIGDPADTRESGSANDLPGLTFAQPPAMDFLADEPANPNGQAAADHAATASSLATPGQPAPQLPDGMMPEAMMSEATMSEGMMPEAMMPGAIVSDATRSATAAAPPSMASQHAGTLSTVGDGNSASAPRDANALPPEFAAAPPLRQTPNASIHATPAAQPRIASASSRREPRLAAPSEYPPQTADAYPPQTADIQLGSNADPVGLSSPSPGDRQLEGAQTPSVVIQKRAPAEVKVGKPASFVIHVQNVGSTEALNVQVFDQVPAGMQLADASPRPALQGNQMHWQLGDLPPGDERTVTLQLVPQQEGELGSVARMTFEAAASVRTISTRPELKIVQRAPESVLIGQQLEIELEVSNPGTGDATGVILQEDVPSGLEHPKGRQLDNYLGDLQPGEVRREILRLQAAAPGVIQNTVRLLGDDGLQAEHTVSVEVVAPQLQVQVNGPSRRYLERQATYQIEIANTGTADATNLEITAYLDRGFTFVSTGEKGQYDPSRHAVFWSLERLPEGKGGAVPLTLLPIEEGEQAIRLEATADLNATAKQDRTVAVDTLAELTFQITDGADPIEVGSETAFEVRIANSGTRNDTNVRVQLQLPPGLQLISSDADAQQDDRGGVFFEPKPQLASGGDLVYRVKVRGVEAGRHITKAIVISDQHQVPVTKEESTMVYSDQ